MFVIWDFIDHNRFIKTLKQTRAATRIQKFVRRKKIQWLWLEIIEDFIDHSRLIKALKQRRETRQGMRVGCKSTCTCSPIHPRPGHVHVHRPTPTK